MFHNNNNNNTAKISHIKQLGNKKISSAYTEDIFLKL